MKPTSHAIPGQRLLSFFSLFASSGTLVCCALPALFVSLGAGAAVAGAAANFPFLVAVSENKIPVFTVATVLIIISGVLQWRARNLPCPIDPREAKACDSARRISLRLYFVSVAILAIGAFFAFLLPRL